MSEYQLYQFRAVDRLLTPAEVAWARTQSSHCKVTAASFEVSYSWGGFRGSADEMFTHGFDAHLYLANWGDRLFTFMLPTGTVPPDVLDRYLPAGSSSFAEVTGDGRTQITFGGRDEDDSPEGWVDDIDLLLPCRRLLFDGDLRPLYVAWLAAATDVDSAAGVDEDAPEPPVPPGLGAPDPALTQLATFLGVNPDLLTAAGRASAPLPERAAADGRPGGRPCPDCGAGSDGSVLSWLSGRATEEKDRWLTDVLTAAAGPAARDVAAAAYLADQPGCPTCRPHTGPVPATPPRTLGQLYALAEGVHQDRLAAAARAAQKRERNRLAPLAARGTQPWTELDTILTKTTPAAYDKAFALLTDLRKLAHLNGDQVMYRRRVQTLIDRYGRRPALVARLTRLLS